MASKSIYTKSGPSSQMIIILFMIAVLFQLYKSFFLPNEDPNGGSFDSKVADVPTSIKCLITEPKCSEGRIDGWTIIWALIYFILGIVYPNQYLTAILTAVVIEGYLRITGARSNFIIGPVSKIVAYGLGSVVSRSFYGRKYRVYV